MKGAVGCVFVCQALLTSLGWELGTRITLEDLKTYPFPSLISDQFKSEFLEAELRY